ncbi:hypothetical protein BLNAU_21621 [Blattamonas nauphoetae]|uniref:Uncharacterized protein n=1 Tax=Blattamonas nauphoetae TaxID=2049346 RepID=A0ABQ9WVS8_9EUKA|nr:hypothetical protein BLNAU_21621 [Blattamonas nauphoetae]
MTPTHLCGLSSDVGNALIAGADEQILGSPPIVQKWFALLAKLRGHLPILSLVDISPSWDGQQLIYSALRLFSRRDFLLI